jgi:hypothetical protein
MVSSQYTRQFCKDLVTKFVLASCKTAIVIGASGKVREHERPIYTILLFKASGYNGILRKPDRGSAYPLLALCALPLAIEK